MVSRQLGAVLFLSILATGYAPHYVTFNSQRYNWYSEGEFVEYSDVSGGVTGWSSPPFDSGLASEVVLEVKNSGDSDATGVEVQLRYSDWGVGKSTWFDVDKQLVDVPAGETVKVSFFPVFKNRAQVSLEASFTVPPSAGSDSGENLGDRITGGGFDELACDSDCSFTLPMRNDREDDLTTDLQVLCLPQGATAPEPCPAENNVRLVNPPNSIPGLSEVLLEIEASLADGEGLTVVVQDQSEGGTLNEVAVSVIQASAVELLNAPMLCCITSVRIRAALGAYLAAALSALEKDDPGKAIALLRFFLQRSADLTTAAPSEEERTCLEKAMHLVSNAARIIAKEQASASASLAEAELLRRAGHHAAAALFFSRTVPFADAALEGRLVHWPDSSLVGDASGRSWLSPHKWTHVAVSHRAGDLKVESGDAAEAAAQALRKRKRKRKRVRTFVRQSTSGVLSAVTGPRSYAAKGDLELVEAGRSLLQAAGELLEVHDGPSVSEWETEVSETVALTVTAENPIFVAQEGVMVNVIQARESEEEGTSIDEAETAVLDGVLRMSSFARRTRRALHRARAARHQARAKRRAQAQEVGGEGGESSLREEGVDDDCTGLPDVWPPAVEPVATEALDKLLDCVAANLGGGAAEEVEEESAALLQLLRSPHAAMQPDALRLLEEEAQRTLAAEEEGDHCRTEEKKLGLCCASERRVEGEGSKLSALLALHERVLDLMDDGAYWVELARDASREGGGFLTSSPSTMAEVAQETNPRVVGGTYWYSDAKEEEEGKDAEFGLTMEQTTKVKTWKRQQGGECGEGAACECTHLSDAEGVCVTAEGATEEVCACTWEASDWRAEVPDWSTVFSSTQVSSRRKGQPLRTLAQDIRVEVQSMKNEGRRSLIGLEQDGIHMATYDSISTVDTTISTTMKKGDRVSLVGFGSFSVSTRKGRAKKQVVLPDPRRTGRRTELDHIGAYNFMVEGIDTINFGSTQALTGSDCEDTYEDLMVFDYQQDGALKLRATLQQPQPSAGRGLDGVEGSCALGDPYDPRLLWELNSK